MSGPGRTAHLDSWRTSATWRGIASQQARKNLAAFRARPRCGATCRTTGDPCRNPAIDGRARCRLHGGATPKGKKWHRLQPAATPEKITRKIADSMKAVAKRARRLARMSEAELVAHRKWQAAHQPGSPEARASWRERKRRDREARALIQRMMAEPAKPISPIEMELAELRAEMELMQFRTGVFA